MAEVTYKDLCLDAVDPERAAAFWGPTLGLQVVRHGDGDRKLDDGVAEHLVWINRVPEPRTVKQRVHVDVRAASVRDITELGATVLDEQPNWTVLADPEGGELCVFVRDPAELPDYRFYELVVDAVDPASIARWWGERFGVEVHDETEQGFSWLEASSLPGELVFQGVPEPKTVKNRIHWDVWGETAALVEAGAILLRARDDEVGWDVLADPEGNEFCVFPPPD